jgi:hypothetical protein
VPWDLFERVVAVYDSTVAALRETNERLVQEIASARAQNGETISTIINQVIELKRDGMIISHPEGTTVDRTDANPEDTGDEIPADVWDAIEERSENQVPAVRRSLISFARKEFRKGKRDKEDPEALERRIVEKILEGEDPD